MQDLFHRARWPRPADPAAASRLRDRFVAAGPAEARLAHRPGIARLLDALGGNSPYLSDLAVRESRILRAVLALGPDRVAASILSALRAVPPTTARPALAASLRMAKRRLALVAALADLGGFWSLAQVTEHLTRLADTTLQAAMVHLLRAAHEAGELRLPDPGHPMAGSGFAVLGMGKLGARELNYSSDIDMILLYDPTAHPDKADTLGASCVRLARNLVTLMEARDADGYVFRTDLRLRPDPASTPPAIALPAALTYYESLGQNWERAAMIKARPVAGDQALGWRFLEEIRPFVWRRHLDFAAIADLHGMKRRIDAHKGARRDASLLGHDLKLGGGGIREIEFIAQTLQLVWAGRDPALRASATLRALRLLHRAGHLSRRAVAELTVAYRVLRAAEHRLQMVADRQTHSLPDTPAEMARFATFMGCADAGALVDAVRVHLDRVRGHYAAFFEQPPAAPDDETLFVFADSARHPETAEALRQQGYAEPDRIIAAVGAWRAGQPRALRSERARDLLDTVLPSLLAALGRQMQPDQAFARFDALISRLPAGVQLLSLLARNPRLLDRLAAVLGAAPRLADHLTRVPGSLEGLLSPSDIDPDPAASLRLRLRDARVIEDAIAITRRFVRAEEFRLAVAVLEGRLDVDRAGAARTDLADAAVNALLPRVLLDFESRYGVVPGGGLAVVALGKAGGREMMAGSDLDLMLVYDHPEEISESTGARAVPVSQYYTRAAHQFVAALTAPGAEGPLYAIDMRLRPSGNKGPVAVSLAAFRRYHEPDDPADPAAGRAWIWERMALTRARVMAAPPALRRPLDAAISMAVASAGPAERIRGDARAMRARLLRERKPTSCWAVKTRLGGLMDVEFVAQTLQLIHAPHHPDALASSTCAALRRLAVAGALPTEDAETLMRADRLWRGVQERLRIMLGADTPGEHLPQPVAAMLLRAMAPGQDLDAFRHKLDAVASRVQALFVRIVGDPKETS